MGTSKEYILMCKKAKGIQEIWIPTVGDLYYHKTYCKNVLLYWDKIDRFNKFRKIWLPRQDQLQGMIPLSKLSSTNEITSVRLLNIFTDYCNKWETAFMFRYPKTKAIYSPSMEQLWLAFVMKEKYNKTWDGKEWVKNV